MSVKQIKTDDADLTRVQANVATAVDALSAKGDPNFVTTSAAQYRIDGTETYVFVNAASNAVTVVLQPGASSAPVIKRIDTSSQKVNVQAGDGALLDGAATLPVIPLGSLRLVFDGKAWWRV